MTYNGHTDNKNKVNNDKSEVRKMSEKEKQILETITKAIPNMSEFNKGYLLGMGEAMVNNKNQESKDKKEGE